MNRFINLHKTYFLITACIEFIYYVIITIIPIVLAKLVDMADMVKNMTFFNLAVIGISMIAMVLIVGGLKSYFRYTYLSKIRIDLEKSIINTLLRSNTEKAKAINILHKETDLLLKKYYERQLDYLKSVVPLIIALSYSFSVSWQAMLLIFFCFIVAIVLNQLILIPFSKQMKQYIDSNQEMNAGLLGFLSAIRTIRHFRGVTFAQHKIKELMDTKNQSEKELLKLELITETVNNIFALLLQIIPILILTIMYAQGYISLGSVLAIMLLFEKIVAPIEQITAIQKDIKSSKEMRTQLINMLDNSAYTDNSKCVDLKEENLAISIENLSFAYDDKELMKDASFRFDFGKKYLLIGENGAGKSTFFKLLTKQISDYQGEITINSKDIKSLSAEQLFSAVAVLPQKPEIFEDSLSANISLAKKADLEKVRKAMQAVELNPNMAEQLINSEDVNISGGELQRLVLARAYYHQRPIFLFDEILVGLNRHLARSIEEKLLQFPDALLIHISHRTEEDMMSKYDQVVKLEAGKFIALN